MARSTLKRPAGSLTISEAAESLGVRKPYLYGMLQVLGIRPVPGPAAGKLGGKPARLISGAQVADLRRRLKEAGG